MSDRTKILFVSDLYPRYEGEPLRERSHALHYIVRHWAARPDVEVEVVVPLRYAYRELWRLPRWRETFVLDGVSVSAIRMWAVPRSELRVSVANLHRHLEQRRFDPDLLVSHMPNGTWCAVQLNRRLRRPLICGLHITDVFRMRLGFDFYREAEGHAYRSRSVRQAAREVLPLPRGFLAESGIPADEILPEREYLAKRLHSPLRIQTVCALIRRKRIDAVLQGLARLPATLPWTYDVYGDGPVRAALQEQARRLGIAKQVAFHGERSRSACLRALEQGDIFVMISDSETFGLVYLEALAKGAIVIGSTGTGIDGVVVHGENGFLCEEGNAAELSELLQDVAARDLAPVRRRALETIRRYTEQERAQAYLEYVLDVAARARPTA